MDRYTILDHPADGKFQAFGATLEEAFANAGLAMASLMWDWEKVEPAASFDVEVRGRDLEQLLYLFLEDVLFLAETKRFLLGSVEDVRIVSADPGFLCRAVFLGDQEPGRYEVHGDVKAVTYHEMKVEQRSGHWLVQVVVDM